MPDQQLAPVIYIPHGGGPLPLLGDPAHEELVDFLRAIPGRLSRPAAILVISAHWEEPVVTVQDIPSSELLYDYYGFPPASYEIQYPAPVAHETAQRAVELLSMAGIDVCISNERGFDHGVFVPLALMYPQADIPCFQVSLRADLDPEAHIALGKALAPLRSENVLILGSGSSFHNMNAFRDGPVGIEACEIFDKWLHENCCNPGIAGAEEALSHWADAPQACYAHPREEHLMPLHVCFGAAMSAGVAPERIFAGTMMGYRMGAYLWS